MTTALPRPPIPIPPSVPRYDTTGRPERVQVEYERRVHQFLEDVDEALTSPPAPPTGPTPLPPQPIVNYNTTHLFEPADAGAYLRVTFTVPGTVAIDTDERVPGIPIGTLIECEQAGIGALLLGWNQPTVVVLTARSTPIQTAGQYTRMLLRKVDTDTWVVY